MATTRDRNSIYEAINSIAPQVDKLYVYDNSGKSSKFVLIPNNVVICYDPKIGDIGDLGKFYVLQGKKGIHLTVDDDIIYPDDYVQRLLELYKPNRIVGAQAFFNFPIYNSFYTTNRRA